MLNIGIISTFPPTQCGIATYSYDLMQSLKIASPKFQFTKIELRTNLHTSHSENLIIQNSDVGQFVNAAEYINSNIDILDIQHEFKIYGKPDGENILILLNQVKKPIVTTLHTVFSNLNEQREKVFTEIIKRSDKLYVFSLEAKSHLIGKYKKSGSSIEIIPHGVPQIRFKRCEAIQKGNKFSRDIIFVSAGHMRSTKGYELAINALYSLRNVIPGFHYFILGSDHPENEAAKSYRDTLISLVKTLGMSGQITFVSEYLKLDNLIKYILSADICLLPYTSQNQSSSGILSLMIACGRPIVSTPFQLASSYINKSMGEMSEEFNYMSFAKSITEILNKPESWQAMALRNHELGLQWSWNKIARIYICGYEKILYRQY